MYSILYIYTYAPISLGRSPAFADIILLLLLLYYIVYCIRIYILYTLCVRLFVMRFRAFMHTHEPLTDGGAMGHYQYMRQNLPQRTLPNSGRFFFGIKLQTNQWTPPNS